MYINRWLVPGFLLLFSAAVVAGDDEQWQFILTPVLWNASVDVSVSSSEDGADLPDLPDYSFYTVDNLSGYLSLRFEANHGRYGILFDSLRASYQDDNLALGPVNFILNSKLGFTELSLRYQLLEKQKLDLTGGVRRTFLDNQFSWAVNPVLNNSYSSSDAWTDPLVGLRYAYSFSDNWHSMVRGDIGGFNVGTQRMINVSADILYKLNSIISFSVGYRYLHIKFKDEDFLSEVALQGMRLGASIYF